MDKPSGNTRKQITEEKSSNGTSGKQKQLENSYYRFESLKKVMKKNDINKQAKGISCSKDEIEEKKRWIGYYEFTQRLVEPIQRLQEIKVEK